MMKKIAEIFTPLISIFCWLNCVTYHGLNRFQLFWCDAYRIHIKKIRENLHVIFKCTCRKITIAAYIASYSFSFDFGERNRCKVISLLLSKFALIKGRDLICSKLSLH